MGRRGRQQGAGRWTQARVAGVRTGAGVRQALGVRGRAGGRCKHAGAGGQRQAERAAGWASGSSAQGARQAGRAAAGRAGDERQARGQAWRGGAGARGWAQGARGARPAWAWPGRWMVADWASWASFGAPGSVLARFLDPVRLGIFLSHQMNIVHYKINFFFFEKKKIY